VRRLPLGIPLLYFAVSLPITDHALALTRRDLETANLASAAAHYQSSGQNNDLWYSRALLGVWRKAPTPALRIESFAMASAAAERAAQTAEDPFNAWYSLSEIYAARNDAAGAERCLRAAIAAHPNWFKPHWTLAQVLRFESRPEEAAREGALALDLDGGKHPEVTRSLAR
jgi:tetratricopeptide (TPR) repeat protein